MLPFPTAVTTAVDIASNMNFASFQRPTLPETKERSISGVLAAEILTVATKEVVKDRH